MADTFTIAGKQYPKPLLYVVGAGGAGIVAYAWWRNGVGSEEPIEDEYLLDTYGDERITPNTLDTYDVSVDTRAGFKTDQEWFNAGIDQLLYNYGVADTGTAALALDRYLNKRPLSATQIPMVNYVINSIGPPPTGTRPITQESAVTPTPTDDAEITRLKGQLNFAKEELARLTKLRDALHVNRRRFMDQGQQVKATEVHNHIKEVEEQMRLRDINIKTTTALIQKLGGTV